jgi:hypothetical protein
MIVEVDLETDLGTVTLAGPDDFTRFHVAVRGSSDAARLDAVLRQNGAGEFAGEAGALVGVDAVRRLSGRTGPEWETDFAAMLDFARA